MAKKKPAPVDPDAEITPPAETPANAALVAPTLTPEQERDIIGFFASGKPMAAIMSYVEIAGVDLETAKVAVLDLTDGKGVPEGWSAPDLTLPPRTPEMDVVFPPEEGWGPGEGNVVHLPRPKRPALSVVPAEPPKPPKPPKDKVTRREESRRFPLTDAEIEDRHALLCTETLQDAKQELADKQIRAEITERRKARKARLQELAGEINDKATTRLVTVVYTTSYVHGTVTETVDVTGEVLAVKPLVGHDAQVPLFSGEVANAAETRPDTDADTDPKPPPAGEVVDEDDGAHD